MNGAISKVCVVFFYLWSVVCVADAPQQSSQPPSGKTKHETQIEQLSLPEDTSPRLTIRELLISGNALISTEELLEGMPLVYNASDEPLLKAESQYLYDLRVIHDIISQPDLPRMVSSRTIQGLTQYILSVYEDNHYAGIYVYVPEASIKDGVELVGELLFIKVLEAPITGTKIEFYDADRNEVEKGYLRRSILHKWSPLKMGEVANQKALDDFVNLLNLNPDRYVAAIVSRGAEPNTLSLGYNIYETNPWHYFIQLDNSGTRDRQWSPRIGLINTNLLGIDDRLTAVYQASADSSVDDNYSLFGSYDFPLIGPRLRLQLYGGYSEFDIVPEAGLFNFLGSGSFYGGILRYNIFQTNGWFFDVTGSLSHERSKITPSLFPEFLASNVKMDLWGVGLDIHRSDDMSRTSFAFNRVESIGGSDRAQFALARTGASPDFSIYTTSANHSRYLDQNKIQQLRGAFRYITPNERLIPAKMTTFGGMYSVRGYNEYEIVADGGILASAQYEFDLVKYNQAWQIGEPEPDKVESKRLQLKKLAPLAFIDFGRARIKDPVGSEKEHETLLSIGIGTILELGDNFSAGVYYGYPLKATDDTKRGKGRLSVNLMLRW
ncbi:MAG: ShlB/FhaC/HecB family hemolysin secretion/activation protein [Planctomycetes bacterium]|nr:ShlB/FhaC/HecB family hemolysin secretion/activation protein [Planctomycetota bacterium]